MNPESPELRYVSRLVISHILDPILVRHAQGPDRIRSLVVDELSRKIAGKLFDTLATKTEDMYGERTEVVVDVLTTKQPMASSWPVLVGHPMLRWR